MSATPATAPAPAAGPRTAPSVAILDPGSGNLRSAQRALERAGARVTVTTDRAVAMAADGLVVPGVGAFATCVRGVRDVGGASVLRDRLAAGRPVLGICVGMQVLFDRGIEFATVEGLGHWPGTVERLRSPLLPHMGWNTVRAPEGSRLFAGLAAHERFYFVHSYAARHWPGPAGEEPPARLTWAHHGEDFLAAVEHGPLSATQFHPEKSGDAGRRLLANWLATLPRTDLS